jgi:hypothetical protein
LVDEEVARKRGLSGAAVRGAFKVVKTVSPSIVRDVVTKLLPDFADALEPMFEESRQEAEGSDRSLEEVFPETLKRDPMRTAEALLAVTDRKIDGARRSIQRAYNSLRSGARDHVKQAVPGLATKMAHHL